MANLLESIGRTNILSSTTKDVAGFFGDLRRMKQEDIEAPMRMGLLQNQLEVNRQQAEMNRNKLAEDARKTAEDNQLFRVKSLLSNAPSPSVGEALLERARERNFIDQTDPEELVVSGKNLKEFWKGVEADKNFGDKLDILYYEDLRGNLNTLEKQRDEMKASGKVNDKTYLQLEQQIGDMEKKMTAARIRYNSITADTIKKLAEAGEVETGITTIIGEDDDKPHVMLYNKSTGDIIKDMGVGKFEDSGRGMVVVTTDEGIFSVDKKKGTAERVRAEGGEGIYGKTPVEVKTAVKNLDDNIAAVVGVKEIYDAGLTGPVTGRAHKYGSKFFSDKEYTQLKNRVGQLRTLVYGLSGKQINETELQWLKEEILPSLMQPSDNFEVTLAEYDAWVRRNRTLFETQYPALGSQKPVKDESRGARKYNPATGRIE